MTLQEIGKGREGVPSVFVDAFTPFPNESAIVDSGLRLYLERVGVKANSVQWPMKPRELLEFSDEFGLETHKIYRIYELTRNAGIIDYIKTQHDKKATYSLGEEQFLAFSAVAWTYTKFMPVHKTLEQRVGLVRDALGAHPLAEHIHDPVDFDKNAKPKIVDNTSVDAKPVETDLQTFLAQFHRKFPVQEPMWVDHVANDRDVREALGIKSQDMAFLMSGARRRGHPLIEPVVLDLPTQWGVRKIKHYDAERMDALAAIAWSMRQLLPEPYHRNWDNIDWKEIGAYAKEALGDNPAAKHIHIEDEEVSTQSEMVKPAGLEPSIEKAEEDSDTGSLEPALILDVDEHYYDSIADPTLRLDLIRFERDKRPVELVRMPVRLIVDTIAEALGVTDPNMIHKFRGLQKTARKQGILVIEPYEGTRTINKFRDVSDVRALFILLRQRTKVPLQKQTPIVNVVSDIRSAVGEQHELYARFVGFLSKEPGVSNKDEGRELYQSEGQKYIFTRELMEEDILIKKPEPPPFSPPMTREDAISLLRSVDKKRMRDLYFFLLKKFNEGEGYIDFNKLRREVFSMVQLAMRARAITQESIDKFDQEMRGVTYADAAGAMEIYISGALSDPRVAQADGSQFYRLVELMERAAREKQQKNQNLGASEETM